MKFESYIKENMLAQSNKYILAYSNGCLVVRNIVDKQIVQKTRIHKIWKSVPALERLLRYAPRAAVAIEDHRFMFSDHGSIYEYDVVANTTKAIHAFEKGMNNPLSFCVRKDTSGVPVEVLYGEYIWNNEKGPVSIYRYDMENWTKIYSFPEKTITHIHNIIYDSNRERYIILTGDEDMESALWEADVNFENVKIIIGGSQTYRACIAYPTKQGIFYATDTPLEQNWLYLLDEHNQLHEIFKMPGPCIYGTVFDECLYMATSVEGDPTLGTWKYRLSYKLGQGVQDRKVHIIKCDSTGVVKEIGSFSKDCMPMWLFQFGNALFPPATDGVYMSMQSTKEKGTYHIQILN